MQNKFIDLKKKLPKQRLIFNENRLCWWVDEKVSKNGPPGLPTGEVVEPVDQVEDAEGGREHDPADPIQPQGVPHVGRLRVPPPASASGQVLADLWKKKLK